MDKRLNTDESARIVLPLSGAHGLVCCPRLARVAERGKVRDSRNISELPAREAHVLPRHRRLTSRFVVNELRRASNKGTLRAFRNADRFTTFKIFRRPGALRRRIAPGQSRRSD